MNDQNKSDKSSNIKPISILLVGRTGVGKSSTINSLFGDEVAPVGHYEATTQEVTCYSHVHDGIEYAIWDTPGLCDNLPTAGNDDRYLAEIRNKVSTPDCVWFVTGLDESRITGDERRGVMLLTQALGQDVWGRSVIVFTQADKCSKATFDERITRRGELIRDLVDGTIRTVRPDLATVQRTYAQSIPVVAVANGEDWNSLKLLPNGKAWIGELFTTVLERIETGAQAAFLASMAKEIGPDPSSATSAKKKRPEQAPGGKTSSRAGGPNTEEAHDAPRIPLDEDQQARVGRVAKRVLQGMKDGAEVGGAIGGHIFGPKGAATGKAIGAAVGAVLGLFGLW